MRYLRVAALSLAAAALFVSVPQAAERRDIPGKYTWNLADLFRSDADWNAARDTLLKAVPLTARFQGHLADSPAAFHQALSTIMSVDRDLGRLGNYASQLNDEDTRVSKSQEMLQTAEHIRVDFGAATAFVRPEILAMGPEKVHDFVNREPRLKEYTAYLENILRWGPHTLSPAEEKVAAQAGQMEDTGEEVYSMLSDADLPYPTITLASGDTVRLDPAAYTQYRTSASRDDRLKVFRAFFSSLQQFRRTLGTTLYAQLKSHVFNREVHKFDSSLQAALFPDDIPTPVYTKLISDVHENLPTLHRYLRLRQKMMGLPKLTYEDLYAPIVKDVQMTFTPEQATSLTLSAVEPLGKAYVDTLRKGIESRWVDWMPSTGKKSGAYSTVAYGTHPYELLNFTGNYEDVSTLAHESGHSMHSFLADKAQPYVTHDYATFVAEVASTTNENLLFHRMLNDAKDDNTRLFLLGNELENLRTTLFRQTMFGEFEMKIHDLADKGQPLSADALNTMYLDLVRQYYGHDKGVCEVDSLYSVEWAYIPHFYYNFYVYQYATSMIASTDIANRILQEQAAKKTTTRDAYLHMLASGSSKEPIDLLKGAGEDMTTSVPFTAAMKEMNSVMDRMEAILGRKK